VSSIAVPVFASTGEVSAAVALIGPVEANLPGHVQELRTCTAAVAQAAEVLERRWFED